jgi:hypothetical protein
MHLIEELAHSQRNYTIRVSGTVPEEHTLIEVKTQQKKLKLTALAWLIEEKMGFVLSWEKDQVLLPMESRNSMRFDQAIPSPAIWTGSLWLRPFKVTLPEMAFFIILDFDK